MKKKLGILMAAVIFALTAFAGCGNSSSASSGNNGIKILLSLNEMDDFRQTLVDGATAAAAEQGIQLDVKDAEGSIENQSAFIKSAESDGYDAIICSPVSIDTVVALKANAGNLPIVFINSCPDEKYLEADKYIYVGSDEKVAGQYQAEYVLDALSDKSELNVVILKGQKHIPLRSAVPKVPRKPWRQAAKRSTMYLMTMQTGIRTPQRIFLKFS